ncbi:MAG: serine/threonine protein kinase [Myxococcales bacterium]|nr:serine/threonine protein kinase [Myxococcales bacterium]
MANQGSLSGRLGPYVVEDRLATGGMAEVFVARREGPHGFQKRVALKRILPQLVREPDFAIMFIDEARLAARLDHPNIVQVFDFGEYEGELVLAMELVEGSHVGRAIRAANARGEQIVVDDALFIISQAAHALSYAHRLRDEEGNLLGVVHRDVSPANLLLSATGHVKLSDFGIARAANKTALTDGGHVRGKLGYMSPEQVQAKALDDRSDVFTLATVFAELLIGTPLFGDDGDLDVLMRIRDVDLGALHKTKRTLPLDVVNVLREGLARDPKARPSAHAFATALDDVIRRRGGRGRPERIARLLQRYELVPSASHAVDSLAPGSRHTSIVVDAPSVRTAQVAGAAKEVNITRYKVRLDDGTVLGPLAFPQMVEMITSGDLGGTSSISKNGERYRKLASVVEFARFVTSPAFQWRVQDVADAKRKGSLERGALLGVVHHIAAQRETGLLVLVEGERQKKIYFVDGRPDYVASTDRRELLGEFLVSTGRCLRMEVEMALALLPRYDGRLGDALVGLGVMRPMELFRAVRDQVRHRYLEAFRWRRGEWAFLPFATSDEETVPLTMDNEELLRDAACRADAGSVREMLTPLASRRVSLNPNPPMPITSYRVPVGWMRLLDVGSPTTVGELMRRGVEPGDLSPDDVQRAVYLGISCRLLEVEGLTVGV